MLINTNLFRGFGFSTIFKTSFAYYVDPKFTSHANVAKIRLEV